MIFLGIDGGGTKTKVIIINEHKETLFESNSGPSSLDTVDETTTLNHINEALSSYFSSNPKNAFSAVFAGLGGVATDSDKSRLFHLIKGVLGVNEHTLVIAASDMENALASGLFFTEGIALIAGTGMVAYGKSKNGKSHKAGGLGYKEGDFGSSYDLGMKSIRALARALDHRIEQTPFTDALQLALGIHQASDVTSLMEAWHTERTKIASLAPIVTTHANLGDIYAKAICDASSYELALAVKAVQDTLKLVEPKLVIVGSLGNADGYFKNKLYQYLMNFIPNLEITAPLLDPAYAAALLALNDYRILKKASKL